MKGESATNSILAERAAMMMGASALFAGLSEAACKEIALCSRARSFARTDLLFVQGEPVRQMVLLQSGSVKLTQLGSSGNEVILRMCGTGDAVGIPDNSSSQRHGFSARAMEQCRSLGWESNKVPGLLAEYPQIGKNINGILTKRLDELQERFREVATEKVAKRLALALLRLVKQVGRPSEGGIEVCFSREELAQMTGTILFSVSRQLSIWAQEGFILPRRVAVVVLDAERLAQACNAGD